MPATQGAPPGQVSPGRKLTCMAGEGSCHRFERRRVFVGVLFCSLFSKKRYEWRIICIKHVLVHAIDSLCESCGHRQLRVQLTVFERGGAEGRDGAQVDAVCPGEASLQSTANGGVGLGHMVSSYMDGDGCTASTSAVWRARSRLSWCPLCQCTDRSMATPRSISAIYGSSQRFAHSWHPRFAKHGCRWAWWSWQRRRMHCTRGARCESAPYSSYDDDDKEGSSSSSKK